MVCVRPPGMRGRLYWMVCLETPCAGHGSCSSQKCSFRDARTEFDSDIQPLVLVVSCPPYTTYTLGQRPSAQATTTSSIDAEPRQPVLAIKCQNVSSLSRYGMRSRRLRNTIRSPAKNSQATSPPVPPKRPSPPEIARPCMQPHHCNTARTEQRNAWERWVLFSPNRIFYVPTRPVWLARDMRSGVPRHGFSSGVVSSLG